MRYDWYEWNDTTDDITDVVDFQKGTSPEVMCGTAEVLRGHGFEKESRLLAGTQSRPASIDLTYVLLVGTIATC